jgi:putative hydrolase of the HAD superfamily
MVHVGDHPEHDVLGAHNAGVRAIWLNRLGAPFPGHMPAPWASIANLAQLPPLLAGEAGWETGACTAPHLHQDNT